LRVDTGRPKTGQPDSGNDLAMVWQRRAQQLGSLSRSSLVAVPRPASRRWCRGMARSSVSVLRQSTSRAAPAEPCDSHVELMLYVGPRSALRQLAAPEWR